MCLSVAYIPTCFMAWQTDSPRSSMDRAHRFYRLGWEFESLRGDNALGQNGKSF